MIISDPLPENPDFIFRMIPLTLSLSDRFPCHETDMSADAFLVAPPPVFFDSDLTASSIKVDSDLDDGFNQI